MEIWKWVPGYEGKYKVSSRGRVKSVKRKYVTVDRIFGKSLHRSGYFYVDLRKDQIKKHFLIHRLIGLAFIDNPFNKTDINHINGNKMDNRVENLEWVTRKENINHAISIGLWDLGEDNSQAKLSNKDVIDIRCRYKNRTDLQKDMAKEYGVSKSLINQIIKNKKRVNL